MTHTTSRKSGWSMLRGLSLVVVLIVATLSLLNTGCRTVTETPPTPTPTPTIPTVLSSVGVIGVRAVNTTGNAGDFELDLYVIDTNGNAITTLDPSSFTIPTSFDTSFNPISVLSQISSAIGPYSAEVLLDQTGSIRTTDPFNLRLIAAKVFLNFLRPGDEVQLSTFQDSMHDGNILQTYGPFTSSGASLQDTVELLAHRVGGGTPLYMAMYDMTDSLAMNAHNPNKALLVFTDGEDNESYISLWDAIDHALQNHVKVFAVALKTGLDTALISIATKTGGGFMHTDDAANMVPYYASLGKLLRGNAPYYKTRWHTSIATATRLSGKTVNGSVAVTKDGNKVRVPFSVTFP